MAPKLAIQSGYSQNGLPYVKMGDKPNIILDVEGLAFSHEPTSGFMLRQLVKQLPSLLEDHTIYLVGRRPNLPQGYTFTQMAKDYADMIRAELGGSVDLMGISTGGQICQYIAADFPDLVKKVVILSAAYRLSQEGVGVEREAAEWFAKGKYSRALVTFMKAMHPPGIKSILLAFLGRIVGKWMVGQVKYPDDFQVEVVADREMNFKARLGEIRAPTLVISGENDVFYAKEDVQDTAAGIPNTTLKLYPGYGHNLTMSHMKEVAKEMRTFLLGTSESK